MRRTLPKTDQTPVERAREFSCLVAWVRRGLGVSGSETDTISGAGAIDWSMIVDLAIAHGVMPLLYRGLGEELPAEVAERLRHAYRENALHNLWLESKLHDLDELLARSDVPALNYKGPILAETAYGDVRARQSYDLDILIAPRDEQRVCELLVAEGFQAAKFYGWETHFVSTDWSLNLDVHTALAPRVFPCPLVFGDLWERRDKTRRGFQAVAQPSLEDVLIILCMQAAKDRWEDRLTLSKVCDIAAVLQTAHALDWQRLRDRVEALGMQRVVGFGVTLATDVLQVPWPTAWQSDGTAVNGLDRFVERTVRRLEGNLPSVLLDIAERLWFHFRIHSGLRGKLAQLHLVTMKFDHWFRHR